MMCGHQDLGIVNVQYQYCHRCALLSDLFGGQQSILGRISVCATCLYTSLHHNFNIPIKHQRAFPLLSPIQYLTFSSFTMITQHYYIIHLLHPKILTVLSDNCQVLYQSQQKHE